MFADPLSGVYASIGVMWKAFVGDFNSVDPRVGERCADPTPDVVVTKGVIPDLAAAEAAVEEGSVL